MKNKGFTLIELLVTLGIVSIVIGLIFSFFFSNYKSYKSLRNESEMHFQAHYILNFIAGKVIDSNSMSLAIMNTKKYSMTDIRSAGEEYQVDKISFKYGNDSENYIFQINNLKNSIKYGKGEKEKEPNVELGNYICEMYVSVLSDESFQNTKAVKLKIVMEKGGQTYEAFQAVYMRNN